MNFRDLIESGKDIYINCDSHLIKSDDITNCRINTSFVLGILSAEDGKSLVKDFTDEEVQLAGGNHIRYLFNIASPIIRERRAMGDDNFIVVSYYDYMPMIKEVIDNVQ